MTLNIRSTVPWEEGPGVPCVWCGYETDIRADIPFRPELGAVPLHLVCGAAVQRAYLAYKAGKLLDRYQLEGIRRLTAGYVALIGSGT